MRPLSLLIEGFTCYRERQPLLDLSNMSLFAIAGPTGAGKSTLLDAMLYALYGMVPRIGKHGIGEFVSHGRNVLSVTFDFSLQGHRYRLMRQATKSSRGQLSSAAALAEIMTAGERSIADTVTAVNQQIEQLLGLSFDAFTQTVILPQNEFARFLQSPAKDRREILQHLLRHQIYEEMRRRAERRKDLLGRDLASKDEQLDRLKDATPEALERLKQELDNGRTLVTQKEQDARNTALQLANLKSRRDLNMELEACRKLALEHGKQAPGIEKAGAELTAARASAAVFPRVEAVETARTRVAECDKARKQSGTSLAQRECHHKARLEECEAAKLRAAEIPGIRERLHRLAEISGDVNRRPHATRELKDDRSTRDRQKQVLKTERAALAAAEKRKSAARAKVDAARSALRSLNYDPEALLVLDPLREDATVADTLTKDVEQLHRDVTACVADIARKAERLEGLGRARAGAESARDAARVARGAADEARAEGLRRHAAASLQGHLHVGDTCPVCACVISELPARIRVPELEALSETVENAAAAEKRLGEEFATADRAHHTAENVLDQARTQLTSLEKDLADRRKALGERIKHVADVLASAGGVPESDVLTAFRTLLSQVQARARQASEAAKALTEAEKLLGLATLALQTAQAKVRLGKQALVVSDDNVSRLEEELKALEARIAAVTTSKDPVAERAQLAERVERLESDCRNADAAVSQAAEQLAFAKAEHSAALQAKQEVDLALEQAQSSLDEALRGHGFESADAVKHARRGSDKIRSLETTLRDFGEARAANQARIAELEPKIAGHEVQQEAVTVAAKKADAAERQLRETLSNLATLEHRVLTMTARVADAHRLNTERKDVAARYTVTAEMAGDLRTDHFQTYLLEEAFKGLVTGASERLRAVSRRYTMECNAKGEFYVLDHDNAGERRRAETLSGGETFMASLCLALQLSEEVLRASGAIRMDSLFIDEGFGTLDVDSLSEVTDGLEALRDDGDRMIGIISHRPELTDRLPGCIVVEKGVGESRWSVEREG
jgi:DNA repair protein SbcC/Rad50